MPQKSPSPQYNWLCWRRYQSDKRNNVCDSVSVSFQRVPPQCWAPSVVCKLSHSHKPSQEKTFQGRSTPALCVSIAIPAELLHTNLPQIMDFAYLLPSSMNDYCLSPVFTLSLWVLSSTRFWNCFVCKKQCHYCPAIYHFTYSSIKFTSLEKSHC